uniref:Cell wall invertase n=1 Tax=Lilium davidii var. unicolor TaxID=1473204 RepID=A0A0B5L7E6_LILDA|nr:cell wall invertase [Lilium davidii var. unicolor]
MELSKLTKCLSMVILVCFSFSFMEASHVVYHTQLTSSPLSKGAYRTGYHFQPPMNWINDPNGPMYYKGIYHLFYQYNPEGAQWGNIVWAHSISLDLINWVPLQPAIYRSKPFDINGCWSGSATILPGNKPAILYTGIDPDNRQVQNLAIPKNLSDPFLREWLKPDYNPVINPGPGINATAFRDPTTAWMGSDGHWRVLLGSRKPGTLRGEAVLYRSRDFVKWVKAKHPLHSLRDTGMWECPDFFPVAVNGMKGLDTSENREGVKHVLKVSLDLTRSDHYTIGTYDAGKDRFVAENSSDDDSTGLRYDYGNFYASKTFFDPVERRRILWGWSNESDTPQDDTAKGWSGIQTIPRSIWLDVNGRQLVQWPIKELDALRGKGIHLYNTVVKSRSHDEIKGISSAQADVEISFDVPSLEKAEPFDPTWTDPQVLCGLKGAYVNGGVGPFGLLVLASADMEEKTAVFIRIFKASNKHVVLMCHDSSKSSARPELWKQSFGGFVDVDVEKGKKISLRSLIDNSVVESFGAGGKTCITSRVYPVNAIGAGAHLFAFNNGEQDVRIENLTAWEMKKPLMNGL